VLGYAVILEDEPEAVQRDAQSAPN